MTVDVEAIREGIAANLTAAFASIHRDQRPQVSAYMLSSPSPPCVQVMGPDEIIYDITFGRGSDTWMFIVQVFVALVSDIGAQKRLDRMLAPTGPESIKEAVERDTKLGGSCKDLRVTRSAGYQQFVLEGRGAVLGSDFTVQVETSN
jgi:hypothetical protein